MYRELKSSQQAAKVGHGVLTCSLDYSLLLIASWIVAGGIVVGAGRGTATSEAAIATDSRWLVLGRTSTHVVVLRRILWTRDGRSHSLAAHGRHAANASIATAKSSVRTILG